MTTRRLTHTSGSELGPVWSPDGTTIAFLCRQPVPPLEKGFLVTADGMGVGGTVAFAMNREKGGEICVVGADGTKARQLTTTDNLAAAPAWSPDGKKLVFARGIVTPVISTDFNNSQVSFLAPGDVHGLFTVASTGGPMRRLTSGGGDDLPSWGPGGRAVAFTTGKGRLAVVESSGEGRRVLTRPDNAVDLGAAWSPDGQSIAFTRLPLTQYTTDDSIYTGPARYETWVMRADGSGQRRVTSSISFNDQNALAFRPRWSPDGREIAVTTVREAGASYWFQVTVVPLAGGAVRQLGPLASDPEQIGTLLPTWSPDGTQISFLSDVGGDFDVYTIPAKGGVRRPLTEDSVQQYDPAWAP